jgi:hypothetical protein
LLLLCLLSLSGCGAPWVWQHPQGLGPQELQRATAECRELAWEEANRYDFFGPYPYPYFFPYYARPHHRHPHFWYDDPPPFYYHSQRRILDEQRFFQICMQAKGWRQVPVTAPR